MSNGHKCLIINIVGPENVGKNVFGSSLVLALQREGERAEFVNNLHDMSINDIYTLGVEMSKTFDFVVMNGGLSYHLPSIDISKYHIPSISYLTVLLNPVTFSNKHKWESLESEMCISELRNNLKNNKMYFIQLSSEYTPEQFSKICNSVLLYHTFLNA